MKLTVKLPDGCPIGAKRERRTVGSFQLAEHGVEPLRSFELPETTVPIDSDGSLIIRAHYTSANDIFSVIARHRTATEDTHVLAVAAECHSAPVSLVCRLPTGQFVEIYLQHDKTDG